MFIYLFVILFDNVFPHSMSSKLAAQIDNKALADPHGAWFWHNHVKRRNQV